MMSVGVSVLLLWSYCGAMSLVAREERPFLHRYLFHAGSVVAFLALLTFCGGAFVRAGHPLMTIPAFVLCIFIAVLLGYRYWSFLLGEYLDRAHAAAMGTNRMKMPRTYDLAEKAEHEGDLAAALRLYEEAAAREPDDPEPRRRAAEIHLKRGEARRAIEQLRATLSLLQDPEDHATAAFRISDLLVREGRPREAHEILASVARRNPGTRFEEYARDRLAQLPPGSTAR